MLHYQGLEPLVPGTTGEIPLGCLHKHRNTWVCFGFCQCLFQRQVKVRLSAGMDYYLNREAPYLEPCAACSHHELGVKRVGFAFTNPQLAWPAAAASTAALLLLRVLQQERHGDKPQFCSDVPGHGVLLPRTVTPRVQRTPGGWVWGF